MTRGARNTNLIMLNRIKKKTCYCDPPCKHVSFLWIFMVRWKVTIHRGTVFYSFSSNKLAVTIYYSFLAAVISGSRRSADDKSDNIKTCGCQIQLLKRFDSGHDVCGFQMATHNRKIAHDIYWIFLTFVRNLQEITSWKEIIFTHWTAATTHKHTCT